MRGQREARAYPQELQGFATFSMLVKPLCQCRARHGLFTCVALGRPVSSPNSRPSLCLERSGLRGVALALSVATYPGWLRSWERNTKFSDRESWRFLEHKCSASCSWAALSGIGCRPKPKKPHGAFASVSNRRQERRRGYSLISLPSLSHSVLDTSFPSFQVDSDAFCPLAHHVVDGPSFFPSL